MELAEIYAVGEKILQNEPSIFGTAIRMEVQGHRAAQAFFYKKFSIDAKDIPNIIELESLSGKCFVRFFPDSFYRHSFKVMPESHADTSFQKYEYRGLPFVPERPEYFEFYDNAF